MNLYSEWVSTEDRLPEDGQDVLIYDGELGIAKFRRGISKEERERMKRGEFPDPEETGWTLADGYFKVKRSDSYGPADEGWNNLVPYYWKQTRGPMQWFGQNVKYWMPLPDLPRRKSRDEPSE